MITLNCAICGEKVEREIDVPRATCFPCKTKAVREYAKARSKKYGKKDIHS